MFVHVYMCQVCYVYRVSMYIVHCTCMYVLFVRAEMCIHTLADTIHPDTTYYYIICAHLGVYFMYIMSTHTKVHSSIPLRTGQWIPPVWSGLMKGGGCAGPPRVKR